MAPRPHLKLGPRTISEEEVSITSPPSPDVREVGDGEYPLEPIRQKSRGAFDQEESEALLPESSGSPPRSPLKQTYQPERRSRPFLLFAGGLLIGALLFAAVGWYPELSNRKHHKTPQKGLLSNGTAAFKPTVLLVSLDGLRAEYVARNLTRHLHDISLKGIRADYLEPVFPSLTFPNHWSLMTGLFAETHGIVANTFYDPVLKKEFIYTDPEKSWDASWWGGEPIWASAEKARIKTANLMWPGPPVTSEGIAPTYYVPFKNHVEMQWKHDKIFEWLDLPYGRRPQLITVYEPSVDQIGHHYGPSAPEVDGALKAVDLFARSIHRSLAERNLSHIVDVIFVSDHGMVDSSDIRLVYIDEALGEKGWSAIEHNDGWPSYGLRFVKGTNTTDMLLRLYDAATSYSHRAFDVYVTDAFYAELQSQGLSTIGSYKVNPMPERYHFSNNPRIAPIYVVPREGWALTFKQEHQVEMHGEYSPKGIHGYDPHLPSMHALFVADGPFSTATKAKQHSNSPHIDTSLPVVMKGFKNVEVYGLVAKLLGFRGAPTNGTAGFWDQWVE